MKKTLDSYQKLDLSHSDMSTAITKYKEFFELFDPEIESLERMNNDISQNIFSRKYQRKKWNEFFAYVLSKYYHPDKKEFNKLLKKTIQNLLKARSHASIAFASRSYQKTSSTSFEDLNSLYLDSTAFIKKDFSEINKKRTKELIETLETYDDQTLIKKIYPHYPDKRQMNPGYKKILGNLFKFNAFFNKIRVDTQRYDLFINIKITMKNVYTEWFKQVQNTSNLDYYFEERRNTIEELYSDWKEVDNTIKTKLEEEKENELDSIKIDETFEEDKLTQNVTILVNKLSELKNTMQSLSNALTSVKNTLK